MDLLFALVIGNASAARKPNDPNPDWEVVAAMVTSAQAQGLGSPKPLKVKEIMSKMAVDKEELVRLQEENSTLKKLKEVEGTETRKGYMISYLKHGGICYRICLQKDEVRDTRKQIVAHKSLRKKVMEVAHNSLFGRHLGVRKTEDRIQTNFFWPGKHNDVTSFCCLCDVCQKTVFRGSVLQAPLGDKAID